MIIRCLVLMAFAFSAVAFNSYANESNCVTAYGNAVIAAEDAHRSAQKGDACAAANGLEISLNWVGTAETECAYDAYKYRKVIEFKKQLTPVFIKFVASCGH